MAHSRCPNCQARLKIPDELLHSKVRCPKCSEPFLCEPEAPAFEEPLPTNQSRSRASRPRPKQSSSLPILLGCIAFLVAGAIWFYYPDPPQPANRDEALLVVDAPSDPSAPAQVVAREHPAMKRVRFLIKTIVAKNYPSLERQLHIPSWYQLENPSDQRIFNLLPNDEIRLWKETFLFNFAANPLMQEFAGGDFDDVFYLEPELTPLRIEIRLQENPDTRWIFNFVQENDDWRISNIETILPPVAPKPDPIIIEKEEKKEDKVYVQDELGGRIFRGKIEKVELVKGTTPSELAELSPLIEAALQDGGLESRIAKKDLIFWENKPIPILLNRLVETPLDGSESRLMEVAAIDGLLQALTHRISTLPMRALGTGGKLGLQDRQNEVLGSWFTWWKVWGKKWDLWKKEANFPPPPRRRGGKRSNNR